MQWLEDKIEEFKKSSLSELQKEMIQLETDLKVIKDQLHNIRIQSKLGKPVDLDWYEKAKKAKRSKGLLIEALRLELRKRRMEIDSRLDRYFREAAREILPEEVFKRIEKVAMEDAIAENARRERERRSELDGDQQEKEVL